MREIPLTRGLVALVDDADYEQVSAFKWYAQKASGRVGAYAARRSRLPQGRSTLVYMHREINSTPGVLYTDHIDGDGLNNQRANLRDVTASQNAMNRIAIGHSPKGAWFDGSTKSPRQWRSSIRLAGKIINLGRFLTERDAAEAYAKAAEELFGEFACTKRR